MKEMFWSDLLYHLKHTIKWIDVTLMNEFFVILKAISINGDIAVVQPRELIQPLTDPLHFVQKFFPLAAV